MARGSSVKNRPRPSLCGQRGQNLRVGPDAGGRRLGLLPQEDAAFQIGHRAALPRPTGDGQDDIGALGRFGQEDVGHDEKIQRVQSLLHVAGAGRGDDEVGGHDQQGAHAAVRAQRVQQFIGRAARPGQFVGVDAPDAGDMGAVRGVVDLAVAGQLVGLLAVFAPALPVALPGEAAVAAVRLCPPCPAPARD